MRGRLAALLGAFGVLLCIGVAPGAGSGGPPLVVPAHTTGALDSTLAQIAKAQKTHGSAGAVAAAKAQGVPMTQNKVSVLVTAAPQDVAAAQAAVAASGGVVQAARDDMVAALVPAGSLDKLAASSAVAAVHEPARGFTQTVDEGVAATGADTVQSGGTNGTGVKVAVIDLGFTNLTTVFSGSPSWLASTQNFGCVNSSNVSSPDGTTAHGTAVVEIVHQMAPGATVVPICVGDNIDLWDAEQWAVNNGVKVINHSVAWFGTSRGDGTGGAFSPDAAVADARAHGILWVNAAGNEAQEHWSGTFTPYSTNNYFNDFGGNDAIDTIQIAGGETACIILTWDEWPVTSQDYDWGLIRMSDAVIVAASTNDQAGDPTIGGSALDEPVEGNCYTNTGGTQNFGLEIYKYSAQGNAHFDLYVLGANSVEYTAPAGSIPQPASSPDAFAVGAFCWQSGATESYSSLGPTIDGRTKPDIEAPDSTSSSVYGSFSSCPSGFSGTSAAAPHVVGAAALLLQQSPSLGVAALESRLQELAAAHGGLTGAQANDVGTGKLWVGTVTNPGRIIAASGNNGTNGIYSLNADGFGVQELATGTGDDPALSPDGTKIAFSANGVIETMNADGSNVTATWTPPTGHFYTQPSWSPDGTKLAFRDGGNVDVAAADGTASVTAYALPGYNASEPVWIDGTKLAVLGTGSSTTDIWTIVLAPSGATTQITSVGNVTTRERSLAVSPDGTKIAFAAGDTGTQVYQLYTINADGSSTSPTAITSGSALGSHFDPTWSPDGTKILFSNEFGNGDGGGLYTINADGTGSETLVRTAGVVDNWFWQDPNWTAATNSPPWAGGLPQLSTSPTLGVGVEATPGRWDGPRPITFTYAWSRCDTSGASCVTIAGATDDAYVPVSADVGKTLRATVTATNSKGSASARSAASTVVADAAPYATAVPTISGTAQSGQSLNGTTGTWTASTSFNYQWLRCDSDGSNCSQAVALNFGGTSYALTSADVGHRIRFAVEAGSGRWATSLTTVDVASAPAPPPSPSPPAPSPPPSSGGGGGGGGGSGGSSGIPPDIHVDVTASSGTSVPAVGADLLVFITVSSKNVGGSSDVRLDLTLPSGWTYDHSYADRGPGCVGTPPSLTCDVGFINAGTVTHVTLFGKVAQAGELDFTATATSQLEPELDPKDNTLTLKLGAPATTPPAPAPLPPPAPPASPPPLPAPHVTIAGTTLKVRAVPGVTYQWQLCTGTKCVPIKGATKPTLKLVRAYIGKKVRVVETRSGKSIASYSIAVKARAASR